MRVLIVEDSPVLRDSLAQGLREAGFAVDAVANGTRGLLNAQTTEYDVIVLDWMLPEMDGMEVLARIRAKGINSAILMLTARDAIDDRVQGLTTGADDYLVKPFAFQELIARVHALSRRLHGSRSPLINIGPLTIDAAAKVARVHDRPLILAPRQFALLEYLALRCNLPVSRAELEEHLYDDQSQVFSNAVDSAVCALRASLDAAGCPPLIHTRRKIGYVLQPPETPEPRQTSAGTNP